jgi:hypothetical protein
MLKQKQNGTGGCELQMKDGLWKDKNPTLLLRFSRKLEKIWVQQNKKRQC